MIKLLVSAPGSGQGKTVLTCALLSALARRGLTPCAFKCGPDYIDPQFHRAVPGVESRNLDLFLLGGGLPETGNRNTGPDGAGGLSELGNRDAGPDGADGLSGRGESSPEARLRTLFRRWTAGCGAAVCEGAMGLYDGLGGVSDRTSAWHAARTLDLPVLLSVRAQGAALTLAAVLNGLRTFREGVRFAGVILNRCSPSLCRTLAPVLEREAGLPILGCLPPLDAAAFPSRHLGLVTAEEMENLSARLRMLGAALEADADLDRLLDLCGDSGSGGCPQDDWNDRRGSLRTGSPPHLRGGNRGEVLGWETDRFSSHDYPVPVRIAIARDEAFCFLYPETVEALEGQGAEIVFFSPLRDAGLPSGTAGLYLPGGYPELYAAALAKNGAMRGAVAAAVRDGLPTVAEGGGFLYLGTAMRDQTGTSFPMAGVLPGEGVPAGRLVRFGYAALCPETDSLLFRKGERIPVHAFHHWDSTENGTAFRLEKPEIPDQPGTREPDGLKPENPKKPETPELPEPSGTPRRTWREGVAGETLYAGFPQLYFAGCPALAARFAEAAARYAARRNGGT